MSNWSERFATLSSFISYGRGLGIETSENELEHYVWNGDMDWDGAAQWPALGRLSERVGPVSIGHESLTDEELIHCIDRELEAGDNPHLSRPGSADFRPWSDYRVTIQDRQGNDIKRPTVEHYYGYWQVHQLYWIQQSPDLYKNARLIERIPEDDPVRRFLPRAPKIELLTDFSGKRHSFDALSFWITVYSLERNRTLASVPESNGFQRLDDVHRTRLTACAGKVTQRFQLTHGDLYGFLRQLIELVRNYERKERYKLAEALKRDIFAWEVLLMLTTGETRDEVAMELGKASFHDKRFVPSPGHCDQGTGLCPRLSQSCVR